MIVTQFRGADWCSRKWQISLGSIMPCASQSEAPNRISWIRETAAIRWRDQLKPYRAMKIACTDMRQSCRTCSLFLYPTPWGDIGRIRIGPILSHYPTFSDIAQAPWEIQFAILVHEARAVGDVEVWSFYVSWPCPAWRTAVCRTSPSRSGWRCTACCRRLYCLLRNSNRTDAASDIVVSVHSFLF